MNTTTLVGRSQPTGHGGLRAVMLATVVMTVALSLAACGEAPPQASPTPLPTLSSAPLAVFEVRTTPDTIAGGQPGSVLVSVLVSWHPAAQGNAPDVRLIADMPDGTSMRSTPVAADVMTPAMRLPLSGSPEVGWLTFEVGSASHGGTLRGVFPDGTNAEVPVTW